MNRLSQSRIAAIVAAALAFTWLPAAAAPGDMTPMKFMLGTWTCAGKALDGTPFSVTQITTISGGQMITHDIQGQSTTTLYRDPNKQQWMQTPSSANGSSTQTSSGWSNGALIFTGTITITGAPSAVGYRSTTTKVNDSMTRQLDELANPTGGWMTFDTAVCTKKSS